MEKVNLWVEKCPQIQVVPDNLKVPKIAIFSFNQISSNKYRLIVDEALQNRTICNTPISIYNNCTLVPSLAE